MNLLDSYFNIELQNNKYKLIIGARMQSDAQKLDHKKILYANLNQLS
jgi:hypothetical protein